MKAKKTRKKWLTIDIVRKRYDQYNKVYFRNSLPREIEFAVVKRTDCLAETSQIINVKGRSLSHYRIEFSHEFWRLQSRRLAFVILLHEMSHLAAGLDHQHDKVFDANRQRLIDAGAYDGLL